MMFSTQDPRGQEVVLKKNTWNRHICTGHNELFGHDNLVKRTVERPDYILVNDRDATRNDYFNLCNVPNNGSLSILKVVVDFSSGTGDIITAYPIKNTVTQAVVIKGGVLYERP